MLYQRQLVLVRLWCVSSVYIEVEDLLMIDKDLFKACLSAEVTSLSKVTLYQQKTIVYNCAGLARSSLLCYMST